MNWDEMTAAERIRVGAGTQCSECGGMDGDHDFDCGDDLDDGDDPLGCDGHEPGESYWECDPDDLEDDDDIDFDDDGGEA